MRVNTTDQVMSKPIAEVESTTVVEVSDIETTTEIEITTKVDATKSETTKVKTTTKVETKWSEQKLNRRNGTVMGPSGKETYYNLNMSGVVRIMRKMGYRESEYPYHIREDGVKMLGPYIMCAADLKLRPRGTLVKTSLGTAIVCDTGDFTKQNRRQLDIAVNW